MNREEVTWYRSEGHVESRPEFDYAVLEGVIMRMRAVGLFVIWEVMLVALKMFGRSMEFRISWDVMFLPAWRKTWEKVCWCRVVISLRVESWDPIMVLDYRRLGASRMLSRATLRMQYLTVVWYPVLRDDSDNFNGGGAPGVGAASRRNGVDVGIRLVFECAVCDRVRGT
ncbi:hypothetical protein FQA39_LY04455 [Lamprigera yunnana]|nr:hypothetical protein FQA39_LY04455 [Lamprigera yunnana]